MGISSGLQAATTEIAKELRNCCYKVYKKLVKDNPYS